MYGPRRLTEKQMSEIYYLGTEGCPCCKCPISKTVLAKKYGVSNSTTSRIINNSYKITPLEATRKEKAELKRNVVNG